MLLERKLLAGEMLYQDQDYHKFYTNQIYKVFQEICHVILSFVISDYYICFVDTLLPLRHAPITVPGHIVYNRKYFYVKQINYIQPINYYSA